MSAPSIPIKSLPDNSTTKAGDFGTVFKEGVLYVTPRVSYLIQNAETPLEGHAFLNLAKTKPMVFIAGLDWSSGSVVRAVDLLEAQLSSIESKAPTVSAPATTPEDEVDSRW